MRSAEVKFAELRNDLLDAKTALAQEAELWRTLRAEEAYNAELRVEYLQALAQCQRKRHRIVLPHQLKGISKFFKKEKRRLWRNDLLIAGSPLFDSGWYLNQNSDVKYLEVDPAWHFLVNGGHEGRQPGPLFDASRYGAANPDVIKDNHNPLVHFLRWGAREGRPLGLPLSPYSSYSLEAEWTQSTRLPVGPDQHLEDVDIIICIHNAYEDVRRCFDSIVASTSRPYRLILVDDGSDTKTRDYVKAFAEGQNATLIRHEIAKGYTLAANAGLQARLAPYCILLNSDTEVSKGWIDRLMDMMKRDPSVGVVGPLSNTASWQSVPRLAEGSDWAQNPLPDHLNLEEMAEIVANGAHRHGIPLGFLNGFCLLLRSQMLDEIGIFDEENFVLGYGEENDLCIRARKAGWKLLAAEDCFVLHKQSKSYGDRRLKLAQMAGEALSRKHNPSSRH